MKTSDSTEATRSVAMLFSGLGAGCLFGSSSGCFAKGEFHTGMFRIGLGFGLLGLILMIRSTMPA